MSVLSPFDCVVIDLGWGDHELEVRLEVNSVYVVFLTSDSTGFLFWIHLCSADTACRRPGAALPSATDRLFDHVDVVSASLGRIARRGRPHLERLWRWCADIHGERSGAFAPMGRLWQQ